MPIVEPMTMTSVIPQTPEIVVVPIIEPMTKKEAVIPQTQEIEEIVEDEEEQRPEIERRPSTTSIRTIATIQINIPNIPNNLNIGNYMNMMLECFRAIIMYMMLFIGLFLMLSTGPIFYVVITCFEKRPTFKIQAFMGSIVVCSIFWVVVAKLIM